MQATEPKIEVVIPNWNGWQMLSHCLQSLERQSFQEFAVIVVDNGSTDDSVKLLREKYPFIQLVVFSENTGFSVAVNAGIEASSAPLVLLLNNDMEVAPDCLQLLYEASIEHKEYDFFALKMLNYHKREIIDGAGDAVLRGGVGYRLGTMEIDGPAYSRDREVFGACAGAALYRREFFDTVGTFDEDFFAYVEDVDLNIRARRLGMRCLYLSTAQVFHIGSATSGSKINPFTIRLSTRNNFYVLLKNYPLSYFFKFLLALIVYQIMWFVFCCKKGNIGAWCKGIVAVFSSLKMTLSKRRNILENTDKVQHETLAKQIVASEKEAIHSIISRRTQQGKTSRTLQLYLRLFL